MWTRWRATFSSLIRAAIRTASQLLHEHRWTRRVHEHRQVVRRRTQRRRRYLSYWVITYERDIIRFHIQSKKTTTSGNTRFFDDIRDAAISSESSSEVSEDDYDEEEWWSRKYPNIPFSPSESGSRRAASWRKKILAMKVRTDFRCYTSIERRE